MNPAAVSGLPGAAVNLRLVPSQAPLRPLRQPHFLFQTPENFGAHLIQTHEAGASVPSLSAMAGATLNTIPVPGCPGALPPLSFEAVNLARHLDHSVVGVRSRKTEPNTELFACVPIGFAK